jgi:hypothetical protein
LFAGSSGVARRGQEGGAGKSGYITPGGLPAGDTALPPRCRSIATAEFSESIVGIGGPHPHRDRKYLKREHVSNKNRLKIRFRERKRSYSEIDSCFSGTWRILSFKRRTAGFLAVAARREADENGVPTRTYGARKK